jgi:NADH-quinone oxidoreductase subunit F
MCRSSSSTAVRSSPSSGTGKSGGTRILCMSGHLKKPGVFELPIGITFRQVIDDICGGTCSGNKRVKAVIPGGSSMPPLDESELDVPIEFDALMTDQRIKPVQYKPGHNFELAPGKPLRTMAGSGGIVVMDEDTDIVAVCARIMRFYAHESCGQCTPCREGTGWMAKICTRLADLMVSRATSICSARLPTALPEIPSVRSERLRRGR